MIRRGGNERDDAALSILIGYIVNLGVAALVVSLTFLLLQGAFNDVRGTAAQAEMVSVGENLASEIERVDVLSQRSTGNVTSSVDLPVSDTSYSINVTSDADGDGRILLNAGMSSVVVGFENKTAIRGAGEGIGVPKSSSPVIRYNATGDVIEIE